MNEKTEKRLKRAEIKALNKIPSGIVRATIIDVETGESLPLDHILKEALEKGKKAAIQYAVYAGKINGAHRWVAFQRHEVVKE